MSVTSTHGGGRLVYGADCRPTERAVEFAQGADLILIEATLPRPERRASAATSPRREAGEHARERGRRRLVLVHISDELDPSWARDRGGRGFGGPVDVAREGAVYEV